VAKKRTYQPEAVRPNEHWVYTTELQINGRNVTPGTELKITKERGRFRFVQHVNSGEAEWIDVWGGPKGSESLRSFRIDRVRRVHYKNQTVGNLAIEHKEKQKAKKAELESSGGPEGLKGNYESEEGMI
jgi:hypothetical protein|tara:strand:- start:1021 stop:1407 length:387 start_codon:yes stop_codon:yes gene_type:complete